MDRTNAWFRRTVLCLVLLCSFPAGASSPEVERVAKVAALYAGITKIIIVGERHDNERLADQVLELLTLLRVNDKFDCLFVEYETDLQDEFDRAVKERDVVRYVEAVYLSRKPLYLTAFRSFGYKSDPQQATIASILERGVRNIPKYSPINRDLLTYLRENKISLLPYDSHSRSKETVESIVFMIRNSSRFPGVPKPDAGMQVAMVKNADARNVIMAQNISAKFASHACNKAVVVVGAGHILIRPQLERRYGIRLDTYSSISDWMRTGSLA